MITVDYINCPICGLSDYGEITSGIDFEYHTTFQIFHFVECQICGVWYLNPRPLNSEIFSIYPKSYEPYHFDELPFIINWMKKKSLKRKISLIKKYVPSSASIIDVGCGNGDILRLMKEYGVQDWELVANDVSIDSLSCLSKEGFKIIAGSFEQVSLESNSFDAVIMSQVIEHLSKPRAALITAKSILKLGGIIFIETPSTDGIDAKIFKNRFWGGYHFPRHWTLFNAKVLLKILQDNNFEIIKIEYLPSPAFWVQSFHHFFSESKYFNKIAKMFSLKNIFWVSLATVTDTLLAKFMPTSNMRIVARRLS